MPESFHIGSTVAVSCLVCCQAEPGGECITFTENGWPLFYYRDDGELCLNGLWCEEVILSQLYINETGWDVKHMRYNLRSGLSITQIIRNSITSLFYSMISLNFNVIVPSYSIGNSMFKYVVPTRTLPLCSILWLILMYTKSNVHNFPYVNDAHNPPVNAWRWIRHYISEHISNEILLWGGMQAMI